MTRRRSAERALGAARVVSAATMPRLLVVVLQFFCVSALGTRGRLLSPR